MLTCETPRATSSDTRSPVAYSTLEHRAVAKAESGVDVRGGEKALHLLLGQRFGKRPPEPGGIDPIHRVASDQPGPHLLGVEAAKGGKAPRSGARRCFEHRHEVVEDMAALDLEKAESAGVDEAREVGEVRPVRLEGVLAQSLLHPERVEEPLYGVRIGHLRFSFSLIRADCPERSRR